MYFAPVVCNLFKGIQNKCISTCMSKKCTQKEFGNLLEYIALGNQCKKFWIHFKEISVLNVYCFVFFINLSENQSNQVLFLFCVNCKVEIH